MAILAAVGLGAMATLWTLSDSTPPPPERMRLERIVRLGTRQYHVHDSEHDVMVDYASGRATLVPHIEEPIEEPIHIISGYESDD